ncbi:hypothetical protein D9611_004974 [Ephemerocybe angulata]|uniref:3'-5' exonuclease domain-containing protein n=1 Tax=Ephemerocybe angulata TaxID=980116 RepID=A0A8H5B306_9AGAR|nr:hypothetical protein D9611_004974 [Tulosesus angulatus]
MSRSYRSHHPEFRAGETSRAQQDSTSHLRLILPLPASSSSRTRAASPPGSLETQPPRNATTTETPASLGIQPPSTTNGEPEKRGRGRPRTKEVVLGPKRPRGRPRKALVVETGPPAPAKPRGRPRKDKGAAGEFRVRVSAQSGPITVPGVKGHLHRPHLQPLAPLFSNNRKALHGDMPAPAPAPIPSSPVSHNAHPRSGPSVHIAPEEDPEGPVDIDEDEETEASGKGIGEETSGGDEGDEQDDERENDGDEPSVNPHVRHSHPPWLLEHFRKCIQALQTRDADGLPALYAKDRTFWFQPPGTWFLLQSSPSPVSLYKPRMFVWDPLALYKKLPCPRCNRVLGRHSTISQPRRCVDLTTTFWIVGFRYRCRNCKHPKTGKSTVTWRSWDPRILAAMPRALSAQFPARLTHRSAVSNDLFSWMRSCFQNGMGSGQFADAVLAQHLLRYDQLHLQYLDFIARGVAVSELTGRQYMSFLPFDDTSPEGFRGFVPSARYFRDIYDTFMDEHRHHFEQHTAMLSAVVCALDHSHKLPKRIATVNHLPVFGALLCFTNEKGEIRALNFVATKAHSQYELTLKGIRESLELYGHESIQIVYTDNVTDRAFLESSFPSLRMGVVPVEKYSHLPLFSLPDGVQPLVRRDESAINVAMSTILAHAPVEEAEGDLAIGFDCEWNVSKMIEHRRLPEKLVMLLQNPRVRKVGRMVASDLKQLEEIVKPSSPFSGAVDLAAYAKERNVVSNARISLSDLCAIVLGKMLRKNISERFSMAWEQDNLTDEQVQYAACDAYAPLLIYQELSKLRVPQPLPSILPPQGTVDVLVYNQDRSTVLASGYISARPFPIEFDNIHLTPTRALVTITEVRVPGALLTSHHDRPLSSFGLPPFQVVCKRTFLRMYDPLSFKLPEPPQPMSVDAATNETDQQEGEGESLAELGQAYETDDGTGNLLRQSMGVGGEVPVDDEDGDASAGPSGTTTARPFVDATSDALGQAMSAKLKRPNTQQSSSDPDYEALKSRVLKDLFHVFNMLRISANHSLRREFAAALRDILFVFDKEDRARITAWAACLETPRTFEQLMASNADWVQKHSRRYVPSPEVLFPLVEELFRTYGPLQDAATKEPLFGPKQWKTASQILDLIRKGYLSDPAGIALYTKIGNDKKAGNLPIYRCARGTSFTEGVHSQLRSRLPTVGVSIRHINSRLPEYVYVHNKRVGTMNTTGKKYRGHYDPWIINRIQERLAYLDAILINPIEIRGMVNTDLYVRTQERLGILPIPDDVRIQSAIGEYNPQDPNARKQEQAYLARIQNTKKAVLPVHTPQEYKLFEELMVSSPAFNSASRGPVWKLAVRVWNERAELTHGVSYKLIEHLKTSYASFNTGVRIRQTLSTTSAIRRDINKRARDPSRSDAAPQLTDRPLAPTMVTAGLDIPMASSTSLPSPPCPPPPTPADQDFDFPPQSASASTHQTPPAFAYSATAHALAQRRVAEDTAQRQQQPITPPTPTLPPQPPTQTFSHAVRELARQRVASSVAQLQPQTAAPSGPRGPRKCQKCGSAECSGRKQIKYCYSGPCQDCGEVLCYGRNSRRPGKPCSQAWIGYAEDRLPELPTLPPPSCSTSL